MAIQPPIPLAVGLLALLAACGGDDDQAKAAASAWPEQSTLAKPVYADYGILPLGTRKTMDLFVPVPETGGEVIVEDHYQGSCSCAIGMVMIAAADGTTRAVYGLPPDQRRVGKGERVLVRLTLDTKDMEPVDVQRTRSRGSIRFQILVDEWARYESRFIEFDYGVHTPITVSPVAHVDFGYLPLCRPYHQTLELSSNLPDWKLQLGEISVTDDCIKATLEQKGDRALLQVTIQPHRNLQRAVKGGIAMPTGRVDYPFLRILVSGTFIGEIEYIPAENLAFNLFDFKQPKERFVNLIDHDLERPPEFALRSIKDTNGNDISKHFEVLFQRLSGRKVRVLVKYLGTMGGSRMGGELSLGKTPDGPEIARIRLTGYNTRR